MTHRIVIALALMALGASHRDTSDLLRTPGVKVNRLAVQRDVFAQLGGKQQVMVVAAGEHRGDLLILSDYELRAYTADGLVRQTAKFAERIWGPTVAMFQEGDSPTIVGLGGKSVKLLDLAGRTIGAVPAWKYGDVTVANVVGDSQKEILVRHRSGVKIHSRSGRVLGFVPSSHYLYHYRPINADSSPHDEIAFWMWRDKKTGAVVEIRSASGDLLHQWNEPSTNRFNVLSFANDPPGLWSARDDAFVVTDVTGRERKRLSAPAASALRYVYGGELGSGRKVFLASGGGYACGSMICIYDKDDLLVHQETLTGRSWAFYIPNSNGSEFFVGNGGAVLRYRVGS